MIFVAKFEGPRRDGEQMKTGKGLGGYRKSREGWKMAGNWAGREYEGIKRSGKN